MEKNIIAALLSFIVPGIGQIVKGDIFKGVLLLILALIFGGTMVVGIGFFLYPLLSLAAAYDAYAN